MERHLAWQAEQVEYIKQAFAKARQDEQAREARKQAEANARIATTCETPQATDNTVKVLMDAHAAGNLAAVCEKYTTPTGRRLFNWLAARRRSMKRGHRSSSSTTAR